MTSLIQSILSRNPPGILITKISCPVEIVSLYRTQNFLKLSSDSIWSMNGCRLRSFAHISPFDPFPMCQFGYFHTIFVDCLPNIGRSEGFPNGIFHPCTLWARALARWKNCRRDVVVGVSCQNVTLISFSFRA